MWAFKYFHKDTFRYCQILGNIRSELGSAGGREMDPNVGTQEIMERNTWWQAVRIRQINRHTWQAEHTQATGKRHHTVLVILAEKLHLYLCSNSGAASFSPQDWLYQNGLKKRLSPFKCIWAIWPRMHLFQLLSPLGILLQDEALDCSTTALEEAERECAGVPVTQSDWIAALELTHPP